MENFLFDEDVVAELNQNIKNLRVTMEETMPINGQKNYAQYEDLMGHIKAEVNRINLYNEDVLEMNARFRKQVEI